MSSDLADDPGPTRAGPPVPELAFLADAVRRLNQRVVRTDAPAADLVRAAAQVEAALDALGRGEVNGTRYGSFEAAREDPGQFTPFSPVRGACNPLSPPVRVWVDDGVVYGEANLGPAYEGPPGCVHGGVIASMFDDILGFANVALGIGAMTATLAIKYRSTTPLETDLTFTARTKARHGRKVHVEGSIHAGARLCAECEGLFVVVAEGDRFPRLQGEAS